MLSRTWSGKRVGAAIVGAATALTLSALPASAAGVEGTVGPGEAGMQVNLVGANHAYNASLIGLNLPGDAKLLTYCIEIHTVIPNDPPKMVEAPWDAYPNQSSPFRKNNAKINWVLHNSYPFMKIENLRKALADAGAKLDGELSVKEAIAGTQAAIWSFSDDQKLADNNPANVKALYAFLTGAKNTGMAQPTPSLDISPNTLTGAIGGKVGPFKVATTADKITKVTPKLPAGVTLTDKDGKALNASAIKDGSELFVSVPAGTAAGEGSFTLEATGPVSPGRVFVANGDKKSQSLIVAASENATLSASAAAKWAVATAPTTTSPAPQASNGALANTGVSIFVPVSIGVLLLLAGGGALLFLRRRNRA